MIIDETATDRTARLCPGETISPNRAETLVLAHNAGVSDETYAILASALRVSRGPTITLPPQRFENLSRGRGWARKGKGDSATWGERVDSGYRVGPGRWTVGGNDGFRRKGEDTWTVQHVSVGEQTWTIAN